MSLINWFKKNWKVVALGFICLGILKLGYDNYWNRRNLRDIVAKYKADKAKTGKIISDLNKEKSDLLRTLETDDKVIKSQKAEIATLRHDLGSVVVATANELERANASRETILAAYKVMEGKLNLSIQINSEYEKLVLKLDNKIINLDKLLKIEEKKNEELNKLLKKCEFSFGECIKTKKGCSKLTKIGIFAAGALLVGLVK